MNLCRLSRARDGRSTLRNRARSRTRWLALRPLGRTLARILRTWLLFVLSLVAPVFLFGA